jgi:hypothetical protein
MEILNVEDLKNKLFCTFTQKEQLDETISIIQSSYNILYKKIFVLQSTGTPELICTYNPDYNNMNESILIPNTILLHRKKETNTLYSINCLNIILKELNNGIVDKNINIDWNNYKNSILLTRKGTFTKLDTTIYTIISLN